MMSEQDDTLRAARRRVRRRNSSLLILAAGMLAFALAAGALYYLLRPTTLQIAVGPAGSEDVKIVQAFAQAFAHDGSAVRLKLVATQGTAESIAL